MLLRYGLKQSDAADAIDRAVDAVIASGARTPDIARPGEASMSTRALGERVAGLVTDGAVRSAV
jgi:3-isopropylmalate dehydrogenase